ncbi:MAG: serine/threonine protein kinase [Deltaproteobacteria bacterium]|nr:serine/threonine protein kinase [Deltaproteobacteria bacterium]MBI4374526.1 serine/threonine protein kinase [Deltaproteobacteria bacterium]
MRIFHHDDKLPETPLKEFRDAYHFQLTRKLAEGGMGIVYEARLFGAEGFEKQVAIKTIREDISGSTNFIELFIGEAKLAARLVHQNIVQIYRLGKVDNTYYVAMEYVRGIDLRDFILRHYDKGKKLPIDMATFIASRVCRGLEYAHSKTDDNGNPLQVVHCDISPKNLMISTEGEVKITDFGISKAKGLIRGDLIEGLGKAAYVSPEQVKGGAIDCRSDLFSLGTVLFELLTGERAFQGRTRELILDKVENQQILSVRTLNQEVPKELEAIVLKALKIDRKQRYQLAAEMGYDLEYSLYNKGYGPTNQTLRNYLQELIPELYASGPGPRSFGEKPLPPGDLSISLLPPASRYS